MPVVNVKSPEIAKMDQEAEYQRQHEAWLRYQLTEEPDNAPPSLSVEQVAVLVGGLIGLVICLVGAFRIAGVF